MMMSDTVVTIDVRELAPPEPLQKIIAAMKRLERGQVLRIWHRVEPCGLFPDIASLGFSHQIIQSNESFCEFVIWKTDDLHALTQMETLTRTG